MKSYDVELETRALHTIANTDSEVVRSVLLATLKPTPFGFEPCHEIFQVIINRYASRGKHPPSVDVLARNPALSGNAIDVLEADVAIAPTSNDAEAIAEELGNFRKRRVLMELNSVLVRGLDQAKDPDRLIKDATGALADANESWQNRVAEVTFGEGENASETRAVLQAIFENEPSELLKTGFTQFDEEAGGLDRGTLNIIAAPSGGGKSTLAMNMAVNAYLLFSYNATIVGLELTMKESMERLSACVSGVPFGAIHKRIQTFKQMRAVKQAWLRFRKHGRATKARFNTVFASSMTVHEIWQRVAPYNYDVIVVDYLSMVEPPPNMPSGGTEAQILGENARRFKQMGLALNAAVVLLVQLSDDNRVKYSRAVEEHADSVWIFRQTDADVEDHEINVMQRKGRNVARGGFQLTEDFAHMRVTDPPQLLPTSTRKKKRGHADDVEIIRQDHTVLYDED